MKHYHSVKQVIDDWDPKKLLHHAPEDEYDPEIKLIVDLLPTATSVETLAVLIHEVFIKMFSIDEIYSINNCYPIALKIWNKINRGA